MFKSILLEIISTYCDGSQKKLSEITKIPYTTINSWINKNTLPGYEQIIILSKELNISADYIMGLTNEFKSQTNEELLLRDEQELLVLYRKFNQDMKKSVLNTLTEMSKVYVKNNTNWSV